MMNKNDEQTAEEEQTTTRSNDKSEVCDAIEQLEKKMEQKFRSHVTELNQKMDQQNIEISKLKESLDMLTQQLVDRQNKRDRRSRSDVSRSRSRSNSRRSSKRSRVSRSRSRSSSRGQNQNRERSLVEREQTKNGSSNVVDNETLANLRAEHPRPTTFAINLMLKLFTMDEMTAKNVNVEGKARNGSNAPVVALSPTRVAELKRLSLEYVALNERESTWRECKRVCNNKLFWLKKKIMKENRQMNRKDIFVKVFNESI